MSSHFFAVPPTLALATTNLLSIVIVLSFLEFHVVSSGKFVLLF